MSCSSATPYTVVRGDTWVLPGPDDVFTLKRDGVAVTGLDDPDVVIAAQARRSSSPAAALAVTFTVVEVDLAAAQIRLTVLPATTAEVASHTYEFEIQVTDAAGVVTTYRDTDGEPFRLLVKGDTTR